jgi:hypothetical protein
MAWTWTYEKSHFLVAVNYSRQTAHVMLDVDLTKALSATDILKGKVTLSEYMSGSHLSLGPWQHVVIELAK